MLFSFPSVTKMFQFTEFPSYVGTQALDEIEKALLIDPYNLMDQKALSNAGSPTQDDCLFDKRVSPFGNLRIKGCLAPPRSVSHAYCVLHRSSVPRHPPYAVFETIR